LKKLVGDPRLNLLSIEGTISPDMVINELPLVSLKILRAELVYILELLGF
jgi:hypothetical protein